MVIMTRTVVTVGFCYNIFYLERFPEELRKETN